MNMLKTTIAGCLITATVACASTENEAQPKATVATQAEVSLARKDLNKVRQYSEYQPVIKNDVEYIADRCYYVLPNVLECHVVVTALERSADLKLFHSPSHKPFFQQQTFMIDQNGRKRLSTIDLIPAGRQKSRIQLAKGVPTSLFIRTLVENQRSDKPVHVGLLNIGASSKTISDRITGVRLKNINVANVAPTHPALLLQQSIEKNFPSQHPDKVSKSGIDYWPDHCSMASKSSLRCTILARALLKDIDVQLNLNKARIFDQAGKAHPVQEIELAGVKSRKGVQSVLVEGTYTALTLIISPIPGSISKVTAVNFNMGPYLLVREVSVQNFPLKH